ncbi:DUF1028 domain-containing protein [Insolitispirillum peregrinum]|uniref:DUF1028 domain-containing protein n=1 Tax=Insolitispirillum peregrinum TaxID=80876 RepID=UPI003618A993
MTFSVLGRCGRTGQMGMAISSSSPAVAARCAWAEAGVGVVATQNITDPALGAKGLAAMAGGADAGQALAQLVASAPFIDYRQLLLLDATGQTAQFSGTQTLGTHAVAEGEQVICGGNMLASPMVPAAMVAAFEADPDLLLPERLLRALEAGLAAGGEAGPVHSAGLLVVDQDCWPLVELRVDWQDDAPLAAVRKAWQIYQPQMTDYVMRAKDPRQAPGYGVPGDDR